MKSDTHLFAPESRSVWLLWTALLCLLLWPAVVNHGAFLFPDMPTYLRGFDAAVYKITGEPGQWTAELLNRYPNAAGKQLATASAGSALAPDKVILAGRSIYYGALLYLSDMAGSFWFMILAQAALVSAAMVMVVSELGDAGVESRARWALLAIPLITPVGYHVGMMMPDILAPIAILGATMIYLFWRSMHRAEKAFWSGTLLLALLAHSANYVIIGGLLLAMLPMRFVMQRSGVLMPIVIALALGAAGEAGFNGSVRLATGAAPVRPPFLTARLTADGPGTDFLNENCPKGADFLLCDYRSELPLPSDAFLWSFAGRGVFSELPPAKQRILAEEQSRFVLAVFVDRPFDVIRTSAARWIEQLSRTDLEEFTTRTVEPVRLAPHAAKDFLQTRAASGRMPVQAIEVLTPWLVFASVALVLTLLINERSLGYSKERLVFFLLVVLGVLINAAVCGMLSTPHDRYQSRVIWLLPFAALVLLATGRLLRQPASDLRLESQL